MPVPVEARAHRSKRQARVLDLPPPFRLAVLREAGDAFAHACARAAELGAGTLVYVGRFDLAELAVILEPEEPLVLARRSFYAGMAALGAALAAAAPPEKPIEIEWPDAFLVDGGLVGGGRLGWPEGADERTAPDWLVFGAAIRTVVLGGEEAGLHPIATALAAEGFAEIGSERLAESFARHLMVMIDRWQESGFGAVAGEYRSMLRPERGAQPGIEENGDLVVRRPGEPDQRRELLPALRRPSWLDPKTGGPRR